MKLSRMIAGVSALAFVVGTASSALAVTPTPSPPSTTQTFNVSGNVAAACLMNFSTSTIAVGTNGNIAIDTTASDPATSYFHMTNVNGESQTITGTFGCNTANSVAVSKGNGTTGLKDNNTSAFDSTYFQNTLPYQVQLGWGPSADRVTTSQASNTLTGNEAFVAPSNLGNITVVVPQAPLGLLSGTYTDTVTVTLTATG